MKKMVISTRWLEKFKGQRALNKEKGEPDKVSTHSDKSNFARAHPRANHCTKRKCIPYVHKNILVNMKNLKVCQNCKIQNQQRYGDNKIKWDAITKLGHTIKTSRQQWRMEKASPEARILQTRKYAPQTLKSCVLGTLRKTSVQMKTRVTKYSK